LYPETPYSASHSGFILFFDFGFGRGEMLFDFAALPQLAVAFLFGDTSRLPFLFYDTSFDRFPLLFFHSRNRYSILLIALFLEAIFFPFSFGCLFVFSSLNLAYPDDVLYFIGPFLIFPGVREGFEKLGAIPGADVSS
jgi:hypothetical protein